MKKSVSRIRPGDDSRRSNERAGEAAVDWAIGAGTAERVMCGVATEVRRVRRRRMRAAASGVMALLLITGFVWNFERRPRDHSPVSMAGAPRSSGIVLAPAERVLPDGSVAQLKDGAEIDVRFSDAARRVTLIRGEVHFQVVKERERPFIVTAGGVETRAVGTAFSVQLGAAAVEVLVTEGRVAVARAASVAVERIETGIAIVDAGKRAVVELAVDSAKPSVIEAVTPAERDEKLSWRIPRLEFAGTPLIEVIRLFHLHGATRILLRDSALGSLQVSGVLRADSVDSLLRLLEIEFGIKAERGGDLEVLLRR